MCVCVCVCTCVRVVGHGFLGSFPCFPCVKTADSGEEEEARRQKVRERVGGVLEGEGEGGGGVCGGGGGGE